MPKSERILSANYIELGQLGHMARLYFDLHSDVVGVTL